MPFSETAHPYDITTQLAAAPSLETSNRLLLQSRTARLRPASDRRCILQLNSASAVLSVVAALSSSCHRRGDIILGNCRAL